jgi:hypothetical protein
MTGEIILYQNSEGTIKLDVRLEEETVWHTQAQICELFQKSKATISEHIKNVFDEDELSPSATVRKFRTVQIEGNRSVEKELAHYNLDVIISVGYRVKSPQGTQFRLWATHRLKEYIIKGFALNDERFKTGSSMNYFTELQERIAYNLSILWSQFETSGWRLYGAKLAPQDDFLRSQNASFKF